MPLAINNIPRIWVEDNDVNVMYNFEVMRNSVMASLSDSLREQELTTDMFDQDNEEFDAEVADGGSVIQSVDPTAAPKKRTRSADSLIYQMGFELTGISNYCTGRSTSSNDTDLATHYSKIVEIILDQRKVKYHRAFRDIRCVEVTSGVLKTWKEVETFYKSVSGIMSEVGLEPHVNNLISGGGHIHVGKMPVWLMANIMRDVQNRPYLNWCLNDPDDNNTNSFADDLGDLSDKLKKAAPSVNFNPAIFAEDNELSDDAQLALLFYGNHKIADAHWLPNDKGRMMRYASQYETLEFRFFRAPVDWDEQKAHIQLVEAYIKYIRDVVKDKPVVVEIDSLSKLRSITKEQAKTQFLDFIKLIGLEPEPYVKIMEDNLDDRFARGTRK